MKMRIALGVFALVAVAGTTQAAVTSYNGSIPSTTTNWNNNVTLPQWNPALFPGQTLTGVKIILTGSVSGRARVQNGDASPADVSYNLSALVNLSGPGGAAIAVLPLAGGNAILAAAVNPPQTFMAPDGLDTNSLNNSQMDMAVIAPGNFALYTGASTIALNVTAMGTSSASGGGNLTSIFNTSAAAAYEVQYTYIPTPGAAAMLGLGGLVAVRRRRA